MAEQIPSPVDIIASYEQQLAAMAAEQTRLRTENTVLRQLYERAPLSYQSLDENGNFLSVNQAWLNVLGYNREEVIGHHFGDFLHPDWRDHFKENFPRFKAIGEILGVEFEMRKKDGSYLFVSFNGKIGRDPQGHFQQTYCIFQDVTRQKQAEAQLKASEARHRSILMTAMDGFWVVDREGRIVEVNETYMRMSGYSQEELLAMTIADLEDKESTEDTAAHLRQVLNRGEDRFFTRHRRKDGTVFDVEIRAQYNPATNGLYIVFLRDITEQRRAEQALRESEERFKALHNASFGGITIHDQGVILDCNQGLAEITGYGVDELIGMDGLLLIAPSTRNLVREKIRAGYEQPYEAMGIRKNGEEFPLRLEARNIPYQGRQVRTVEFRDITALKEAEAERERLQDQLVQAQKMESVGRLAGGIAHDFNNMLGVILGRTEMAQENVNPSLPLYADLEDIRKAAVRSANLTRQLLAFARKQTIAPQVLNFNTAVSSMLNMVQRLIGEDIDLVWLPRANLWPVRIDPSQLDQVLANLCVNARDAIAGVGKITIETENITFDQVYCANHHGYIPGEYVQLAISDDGCGMDRDALNHIFEPFYTTKETGKGTGLGLATVYGIVKQNNGFINVYTEPGQGTTFRIYLPRHSTQPDSAAEGAPAPLAKRGHETILLVEDEPAILAMTTTMLERLGYTTLPASTPDQALVLAESHDGAISLLLTDVVMPGMNGRDLARQILALHPEIRVLFMSGYTANVIAHHGVLDRGVQFIEKPFAKKDLAAKVREALHPLPR